MTIATTAELQARTLWLQLHDSALPAGRMVHSNGLEEWLARRPDAGEVEIEGAVLDYVRHGHCALDATVTAAAWRAAPSPACLNELDELLSTHKLSGSARSASTAAGTQLATVARHIGMAGDDQYLEAVVNGSAIGHLAVVEGGLQARIGIDVDSAVLGSARAAFASMLSAAVRLGRLRPMAAQRIQLRHVAVLVELTSQACARSIDDIASTAVQFDIAGMQHETRRQRLFAS